MKKIEDGRERPPFFSSWSRWYVLVLLNLALQILVFYLLTRVFQ